MNKVKRKKFPKRKELDAPRPRRTKIKRKRSPSDGDSPAPVGFQGKAKGQMDLGFTVVKRAPSGSVPTDASVSTPADMNGHSHTMGKWLGIGASDKARKKTDQNLIRLNMNLISLFFLCVFAISLFSLVGNMTKGVKMSMPGMLLFVLQAIIGYVLIIHLVLPRARKRKVKIELLDYKIFFVVSVFVIIIVGIGWLFKGSAFIQIVSFPAFCISILCLIGGIGVALKRSLFSYTVFFTGLILLIVNAIMDMQDYSRLHSIIFALSGFFYLELTGAGERLSDIESRMIGSSPESDEQTLHNYKATFIRRFTKYCSISMGIFILILLFPLLFKFITASFSLKGYSLMLSESVEINTIYIYLLPASIALMILIIIKFIRFTNIHSPKKDEKHNSLIP